jgi:hypothetical protein
VLVGLGGRGVDAGAVTRICRALLPKVFDVAILDRHPALDAG